MLARIWNIASKELTQLFRNRFLVILIILGPWTEMVMVGYSTSVGINHLPTAVVDMDKSWASRRLVQIVDNTSTFQIDQYPDRPEVAQTLLERGSISAAFIIPQGFAERLVSPLVAAPQVEVLLDGSEPAAAQTAQGAAEGAVASFGQEISANLTGGSAGTALAPIDPNVRVWFNEEMSEANYTLPSEVGFMLAGVTLMVACLGIAREREMGTLEQLMVTPLRSLELVIGKAAPAVVMGYMVFLAMLGVAIGVFGIPMRGSWPLLLGLALFYIFVELGWGIMVSAIANTQQQALLLVFVLIMVEMVFSGYAFPVDVMPKPLQIVSNAVPIKHWLLIFRGILLKGAGLSVIWPQVLALAILGTIVMTMTVLVLRARRL